MRYIELMESSDKVISDLQLPDDFWAVPSLKWGQIIQLSANKLTSLVGCPDSTNWSLLIAGNKLTSLVGCPQYVGKDFDCSRNEQLESLIGGPQYVGGHCNFSNTSIHSLEGAPKKIMGPLSLSNCPNLTSLANIHKISPEVNGNIHIDGSPIVSHVLGVFLIKGIGRLRVSYFSDSDSMVAAIEIVNKHLGQGRAGLLPCQAELIANGLDDFAQI